MKLVSFSFLFVFFVSSRSLAEAFTTKATRNNSNTIDTKLCHSYNNMQGAAMEEEIPVASAAETFHTKFGDPFPDTDFRSFFLGDVYYEEESAPHLENPPLQTLNRHYEEEVAPSSLVIKANPNFQHQLGTKSTSSQSILMMSLDQQQIQSSNDFVENPSMSITSRQEVVGVCLDAIREQQLEMNLHCDSNDSEFNNLL